MAPLIVLVVVAPLARLIGHLGVAHLRDWAACTRVGSRGTRFPRMQRARTTEN